MLADETLNVALEPTRQLQEVVVESDRPETGAASTRMSATSLSMLQVQRIPAALGEADVLKTIQLLPGVLGGISGSSQFSVRGGNVDQNLFLLDGIMLYNVYHVLGFESAFMPDAVKHVDFYSGSFPARYGSRLSSVTDVRTKDGDMQHYHGLFTVGLLSSHLALEGPIVKGRTSFMITARRSYVDWFVTALTKWFGDDDMCYEGFYFYDLNVKVNHKFSDRNRLFLSYYQGRDGMSMESKGFDMYSSGGNHYTEDKIDWRQGWGNQCTSLRWNHLFSSSLFSNLTLGFNRYRMLQKCRTDYRTFYEDKEVHWDQLLSTTCKKARYESGVDDYLAIYDFDYHPDRKNHVKFGGSFTLHDLLPESQKMTYATDGQEFQLSQNQGIDQKSMQAQEYALYAENDLTLSDCWQMLLGLRGSLYHVPEKSFWSAEPRLSVAWLCSPGWHLKGAYSLMHQYVLQLSTSSICLPTDLWVSVNKDFKPMRTHQWSVGVACDHWAGWDLTAECYYKNIQNVFEYLDGATFTGGTRGWENKVAQGEGRSKGIELGVSRTVGRAMGSVAYTLSKTDRCFPDGSINNGRRYPYEYDHRHVLHLSASYQFTPHVDMNVAWHYASGGYGTIATQTSIYETPKPNKPKDEWHNRQFEDGDIVSADYFPSRCNYHMKPSHQLDMNINIHHTTKHGERIWNFSLMNAYMHRNQDKVWTETYYPDLEGHGDKDKSKRRRFAQVTVLPILPSASYTYKF